MSVGVTRAVAKAAVLEELDLQKTELSAWEEMRFVLAIAAIRKGDHDIALYHIATLRRGPTAEDAAMKATWPLKTREQMRAMLDPL